MTPTIYMLYVAQRAFLWYQPTRDDKAAKHKAQEMAITLPPYPGRLFTGPTGVDEMEFVCRIRPKRPGD